MLFMHIRDGVHKDTALVSRILGLIRIQVLGLRLGLQVLGLGRLGLSVLGLGFQVLGLALPWAVSPRPCLLAVSP